MSVTAFLPIIGNLLDRLLPDKTASEKAKQELALLAAKGELDLLVGQLEVNKNEAESQDPFVSRWRPFIGWVCGVAFAYHFLIVPLLISIASVSGVDVSQIPRFDMDALLYVLGGLLGLGGLRTVEKIKQVVK